MKHYFLNLTNGIEYLENIPRDSVTHFMRIRSTTLERKDYMFLLMDLDHNFLLHLALGKECVFVDYGTNKLNSKTCYTGIPFIEYCLNRRWLGKEVKAYRRSRSSNNRIYDQDKYYSMIYDSLFTFDSTPEKIKLKRKLDYFKRFLNTNEIKIECICNSTSNDGNYDFYAKKLKENYETNSSK